MWQEMYSRPRMRSSWNAMALSEDAEDTEDTEDTEGTRTIT